MGAAKPTRSWSRKSSNTRRAAASRRRIVEVLGDHMAPGMEIEVAIRAYDLPHVWPDAVLNDVASLTPQVPEEAKENAKTCAACRS